MSTLKSIRPSLFLRSLRTVRPIVPARNLSLISPIKPIQTLLPTNRNIQIRYFTLEDEFRIPPQVGSMFIDSHEWALISGEIATIGISFFAQAQLGEIVYCELPNVGLVVKRGEQISMLESVKSSSEIFTPLSGEVVEINEALVDKPELINMNPYNSGWIVKIKVSDLEEKERMMTTQEYDKHLEIEHYESLAGIYH